MTFTNQKVKSIELQTGVRYEFEFDNEHYEMTFMETKMIRYLLILCPMALIVGIFGGYMLGVVLFGS